MDSEPSSMPSSWCMPQISKIRCARSRQSLSALAAALQSSPDDIDAALSRYEAVRQTFGERVMLHARRLGTYFGVGVLTAEDRRMAQLLRDHRVQMDWIAVPNFLDA